MSLAITAREAFGAHALAWIRIAILAAIAAAGLVHDAPSDDERLFFLIAGLAGIPLGVLLLWAVRRLSPLRHALLSAAVDLAVAVALHVLVPDSAQVARLAYVLIPASTAFVAGFGAGAAVTVAGAVANAAIDLSDPDSVPGDFSPGLHLARLALSLLLVYVVGRAVADRSAAQASVRAASIKAEAILSKVTSAVVVTSRNGELLEWNEAAHAVMHPVEDLPKSELTCQAVLNLYAGERELDCSNGCGLLRLRADYPDGDFPEISRRLSDGRRQPLHADAAAVVDSDGRTVEVVHSLLDVTRLKQADEAKTLFLATASHELKTPLTVISGFAELLLAMPDLPEAQRSEALETIRRRTTELSAIVDRLLLSSRIEAGRVQVNMRDVDVEPLVRERADALQKATGRTINVVVRQPVPVVEADPGGVTTVVDHLLENGIRYSPGGEPVDALVAGDGDAVDIQIVDRGIGMDPEQQAHCFDRFWQAESSDVRRFGGTGIGLYIVKSLVEAMHGTISVESAPGRGTTFRVRLTKSAQIDLSGGELDEAKKGNIGTSMRELGISPGGAA